MARCPAGHESGASDYCDTCGLVMGAESAGTGAGSAALAATVAAPISATATATTGGSGGACPVCHAERNGRFCEECGYDFELAEAMPEVTMTPGVPAVEPEPAPEPESAESEPESELEPESSVSVVSVLSPTSPLTTELELLVNADRDYYKAQIERGDIIEAEFPYPKYPHERRFTFAQSPIRIGRASASRGIAPEIDLTGPPLDPAVSHLHAQLLRHEEGWVVVDLDSANGTRLNDSDEPLEAETEIPVRRGDRIHLGVWTTITIQ
jgi:hypothetical protein